MAAALDTTIRVPTTLRNRVRNEAKKRGVSQADVVAAAMRELEQADFLRAVAEIPWDDAARQEALEWDDADLGAIDEPWAPTP